MTTEEVGTVVTGIARRLARRARWEEDDLVQAGWTAALSALERAQRLGAACAGDYVAFAVWRELSGYLLDAGSPASAKRYDRAALAGVTRTGEALAHDPDPGPTPEDSLAMLELQARLRARLEQVARSTDASGWLQRELDGRLEGQPATRSMRKAKERLVYRARQDRTLRALYEGGAP